MKNKRIVSIDLLRGVVLVIMALDHVRDFNMYGTLFIDPTNLETTTPLLFFTRWITHFCAPVFVFLAGTSAYLYGLKKQSKNGLAIFLLTRGLWIVFIELVILNFIMTLDITFSFQILQVLWIIGLSMIILAGVIYLPEKIAAFLGIIMIVGHNLLDPIVKTGKAPSDIIWYLLHQQSFQLHGDYLLVFYAYPIIPWIGVMIMGYLFGKLYQSSTLALKRKKWLIYLGIGAILLFILLRATNFYGDLKPWERQGSFTFSMLSFFNVAKYPPSLQFLLITLGPAMLFLWGVETIQNRITKTFVTIGRVSMFYYVVHWFLVRIISTIILLISGRNLYEAVLDKNNFFNATLANYGYGLAIVYILWLVINLIMFPICKNYLKFKQSKKDKWWISYI